MKKKKGLLWGILGIPAALIGFPKNLFKQPRNAEELERYQRAANSFLWIALIPVIVDIVLMSKGADEGVTMLLGMAGFGLMIALAVRKNRLKNNYADLFEELTCPNCSEIITFDENVRYTVLNIGWSVSARKSSSKRGEEAMTSPHNVYARGTETTKVEITCKCQKCGNEKTFTQDFCTGECSKEQRNVSPAVADILVAQFEKEVRSVSKAVFDREESGQNEYGVRVHRYDLEASIADHFVVKKKF